jgi:tRNA nucleotidyltransferase (CCA-adding enzyme)
MSHWEHFHHQADIGVRGYGKSMEEAFEQAASGLTAVISEPEQVVAATPVTLNCEAPDRELLFADWLNALIYEMTLRKMLFSRFEVHIRDNQLNATAWGEPIDIARHRPVVEIKGATYTELYVDQIEGTWIAQCVVDV